MNDRQREPVDVDALLDELEGMEVPPMTAEFESQAMERIRRRKEALDAESETVPAAVPKGDAKAGKAEEAAQETRPEARILRTRFRACIAAAAALVFLIGGTLLTRGSLRAGMLPPRPGTPAGLSGQPTAYDPSNPGEPEAENSGNGFILFLEDMWLFVKAAAPYLGSAAAGAAVAVFVLRKKE